jgi:membrane-bound serine protease (ClpP class)
MLDTATRTGAWLDCGVRSPARRLRLVGALGCLVAGVLSFTAGASTASTGAQETTQAAGGIDVVQVNGLLDPPNAALIRDSLSDAERDGATVVVFQLDGGGAIDVDVAPLVRAIQNARVPVAAWVGPSSGGASGATALLALSAPVTSVAPGADLGPVVPVRWDRPQRERALADDVEVVRTRRMSGRAALEAGAIDGTEATLQEFVASLDGRTIETADGPVELSLLRGEPGNRRLNQEVRFHKLDLTQQLAHTLDSPWVAYFLFVAGLALIVFEFFTAGVGIAGAVGAFALIGGCFGFSHLPVAPWAVGLLMFGIFGLSIDIQAGGLGPWTYIGGGSLVAGSIWLYDGSSQLDPAWWVILLVCAATLLFMISGMTAMVRSRFSTPTIGREALVGTLGTAEVDVAPDGVVRINDALWRARTNRATPIHTGDAVRVVSVEGVVLEVEPESGGAKDYRDRGRHRQADDTPSDIPNGASGDGGNEPRAV